jgi:hypothetical protein
MIVMHTMLEWAQVLRYANAIATAAARLLRC